MFCEWWRVMRSLETWSIPWNVSSSSGLIDFCWKDFSICTDITACGTLLPSGHCSVSLHPNSLCMAPLWGAAAGWQQEDVFATETLIFILFYLFFLHTKPAPDAPQGPVAACSGQAAGPRPHGGRQHRAAHGGLGGGEKRHKPLFSACTCWNKPLSLLFFSLSSHFYYYYLWGVKQSCGLAGHSLLLCVDTSVKKQV